MQFSCQVTGRRFAVQEFGAVAMKTVHPVCALPLPALYKLASQQGTDAKEDALLFRAYLFQSGAVKFSAPITDAMLTATFITEQMPALIALCNAPAKALKQLPQLHIHKSIDGSTTQTNIKAWLQECTEILQHGRSALRSDNIAEYRAIRRAVATRQRLAAVHFSDVLEWGFAYLNKRADFGRISDAQVNSAKDDDDLQRMIVSARRVAMQNLQNCCNSPCNEPIQSLKDMRALCLDYLPENDEQQLAKKDAILQRINANILVRAEFLQALGMADVDTMETVAKIAVSYTIMSDDEVHINNAKPAAASLVNILAQTTAESSAPATPVPTSEPKRESFSNNLQYMLAMRAWQKTQGV